MEKSKASAILCLALFVVFSSSASAFDIIKLLEKQSDLTNFVTYLKETKLGDQINSRSTITVLAVGNKGISSLAGKSKDVVKKILSAHVVLDYFDEQKLTKLAKSSQVNTLTTLFQASGQAQNQQGFINVGLINEGELAFGTAAKGGKLNAKLVKSVVSQPFNVSVLELTEVIDIPDISSAASSPAGSPKASADAPTSHDKKAPSLSPKSPKSKAPSPSDDKSSKSKAPSPSDDDVASPPVSADAPTGSPVAAPSAASRVQMAVGAGVMIGLASLLVA